MIVAFLCALSVAPSFGDTDLDGGMFATNDVTSIGAGLHQADSSCRPESVSGRWSTVAQKLMKFFGEVRDGVWPGLSVLFQSYVARRGWGVLFVRQHDDTDKYFM